MRRIHPDIDAKQAFSDWSSDGPATKDDWTYYNCKLVTPLYGGGVRAGEVDAAMPIRASGIRGQLRYWWRVACGPFPSSREMFRRETAIWGGIGTQPIASQVSVRVDKITGLKIEPAFVYQDNHKAPGQYKTMPKEADWVETYAMFPARGELTKDKTEIAVHPHRLARAGLGFRLGIRLQSTLNEAQCLEVMDALRWWASFGGVGARTRRGLGAVQVSDLAPVTAEDVAKQGGELRLLSGEKSPEKAWKISVGRLSQFRQGVNLGRNPKSEGSESPAGRSRWPEPDMIRRQTHRHAPKHAPTHRVTDAYPRGAFGLPIVFHFKDENKGEPPQQLLVPQGGDRMASQLILRPYGDGQTWQPAALLVPGWRAALDVQAGFREGTFHTVWPADPHERHRLAAEIGPMAAHGDDPLSAFMDYFGKD